MTRRSVLLASGALAGMLLVPGVCTAHGVHAGDVVIDHPYAPPSASASPAGPLRSPVYLRAIRNGGRVTERLVGAHTDRAAQVQLPQGPIVMPPGAALRLRHDGPAPLELLDPTPPLRDGDRFTLTLRFERAGAVDVDVWVQSPRVRKP